MLTTTGSFGLTSNSIGPINRASAMTSGTPIASPTITSISDSRNTIHSTRGARRAEREADAELRGALLDGVRHQSVEPEARERQRQDADRRSSAARSIAPAAACSRPASRSS